MPIILLTENVPFFFRSPIFDECFGKYSPKRALLPWYRSLSLNYRIYPDIIRTPIRAYSRPKLWVIFTPFSLKNFWKPPFLCLFGHILHPYPPRLDYALAVYLIPSFSQISIEKVTVLQDHLWTSILQVMLVIQWWIILVKIDLNE